MDLIFTAGHQGIYLKIFLLKSYLLYFRGTEVHCLWLQGYCIQDYDFVMEKQVPCH